jgi:hypothetical protein
VVLVPVLTELVLAKAIQFSISGVGFSQMRQLK